MSYNPSPGYRGGGPRYHGSPAFAPEPPAAAPVYVDTTRTGPTVPGNPIGLNVPFYDGVIMTAQTQALLAAAGVRRIRWPGGAVADHFHWRGDNSSGNPSFPYLSAGYTDYVNPLYTLDALCGTVLPAVNHGVPVFTVNYGSGTGASPGGGALSEAGALAARAVSNGYGGAYYEIGDEQYAGDGGQGSGEATNLWSDKSPAGYVSNATAFISAIKSADPTAKIIVPYCTSMGTMSTGWSYQQSWNQTVLSGLAGQIDALGLSLYPQAPGGENDAFLLGEGLLQIPRAAGAIAQEIAAWGGGHTPALVAMEMGGCSVPPLGKQSISDVSKVYAFEALLSCLEAGFSFALWFAAHATIYTSGNNSSALYNAEGRGYGDFGILSSGLSSGGQSEPPTNTPFPPYFGLLLAQYLASGGETLLQPTSLAPRIGVHASLGTGGLLNVGLTNRAPSARRVQVNLLNYSTVGGGTLRLHTPLATAISTSNLGAAPGATALTLTLPAYSIAVATL